MLFLTLSLDLWDDLSRVLSRLLNDKMLLDLERVFERFKAPLSCLSKI
jgi:hypothetical protein